MTGRSGIVKALAIRMKRLEGQLLEDLGQYGNAVPKKRNAFFAFVSSHFDTNVYTSSVVKAVWNRMRNRYNSCNNSSKVLELENKVYATKILDFDYAKNDEEDVKIVEVSLPYLTSPKKNKKVKKSEIIRTVKTVSRKNNIEERDLLKKFKQEIIIEELLKRDQEMLKIQNCEDKFQKSLSIQVAYEAKMQKERLQCLAEEKLRLFRLGLLTDEIGVEEIEAIYTASQPKYDVIPSENVVIEKLPYADLYSDVKITDEFIIDDLSQSDTTCDIDDRALITNTNKRKRKQNNSCKQERLFADNVDDQVYWMTT